ncbi:MAG: PQQ-binding-like beta-propeller repeat protein [Bacteroidales bacterium]|nr:PQQ-binding-like beta-propeller repeat protein [Bacteroidales bacterium]
MKKLTFTISISLVLITSINAQIGWRNDRTGIFANETGLLTSWPENGPKMLWYFEELGDGHSGIAISNGKIYATGMLDGNGYLFVFDLSGNLLNRIQYGVEWTHGYNGTRATPTITGGKIYIMSGMGELICLNEQTLEVVWRRNIRTEFDGRWPNGGFSESLLVIGNKVIATPGGEKHNIIALDKNTGELIWSTPAKGDPPAHCSPLYIGHLETPLIVTLTGEHIVGIEASTGKMLWSFPNRNTHTIHGNTPIYANGMILATTSGQGSTMLRLSNGGRNAEVAWTLPELDNSISGVVKVGNYVFGAGAGGRGQRAWFSVEWETGELLFREAESGLAVGVIIYADGMLFCYSDRGDMALVPATPERFEIVSRFRIEKGTDQHLAHPTIYQGVLYVRRGNTLMAFNIR